MRNPSRPTQLQSSFDVILHTDTLVVLLDQDRGRFVTNDAENVIPWLNEKLEGGLGRRRVFYRDTTQTRFDELKNKEGQFIGFAPCSESQQVWLTDMVTKMLACKE